MKLARTVAHTTDVDGMLDSMTPQQFSEWLAMYTIEPWGVELVSEEKPKCPNPMEVMKAQAGV